MLEDSWQQALELVLGENESFLRVDKNLNLPEKLSNGVLLEWYSSDASLVNWEGEVNGTDSNGTPVVLMATLRFQGEEIHKVQELVIYPAVLSEKTQRKKKQWKHFYGWKKRQQEKACCCFRRLWEK